MIPVGHLAPSGCWDENLLTRLFDNELYPTGLTFKHFEGYPNTDGCALTIPGRYWHQHTDQITEAVQRYGWVLGFRIGDEEDLFDISKVEHPNCRWWVQTPRTDRQYNARLFGVGFPPHFNRLPSEPPEKPLDVFLAAQDTHGRRHECFDALDRCEGEIACRRTEGFTQGLDVEAYQGSMVAAKIAPAPAGPESPDTFRLYEALEAHCLPIADDVTPRYDSRGYWRTVFPDAPFPIYTDADDLPGYIEDQLEAWPANANRIAAWWMRQKRRMAHWLQDDLQALGAVR